MISGARRRRFGLKRARLFALFSITVICAAASFAQTYKVDAAVSQALTNYLRQNQLPLVGAQVLGDGASNRRIVLYGFVASQFGKNDAAHKSLAFVENGGQAGRPAPQVENRIEIRPELAGMKTQTPAAASADSASLDQVLDDIDRYGVKMVPSVSNSP